MKSTLKEFKDFIIGGSLIDTAVALILALYVKGVIDSLVDIVLNFISGIFGTADFNSIKFFIGDSAIHVGVFLTAVVNLIIVGGVLFLVVKGYNKLRKPDDGGDPVTEISLLTEIRDTLNKQAS